MLLIVAMLAIAGGRAIAVAPSPSTTAPRSIAVSVPSDPVEMTPGRSSVVRLRVVNPGDAPVQVTIQGRGLTLGDEGKITVQDGPDELWNDNVAFPVGPLKIPAQGYKDLAVTVHPPADLSPDLYFLGFVVTPIPGASSGVTVINQIGGYFTIDIPGPRDRQLSGALQVPGWAVLGLSVHVGTQVEGTVRIQNIGTSTVQFWGETDTSTTAGDPGQVRIPTSLVPASHERTFEVVTKPAWPIGFVHLHTVVIYPTSDDATTAQIEFTRSVLVVNPIVFVILAAIVLLVVVRRVRARRQRRGKGAHLKTRTRSLQASAARGQQTQARR